MSMKKRSELLFKISPKAMQGILGLTSVLLVLVVIAFAWLYREARRVRAEWIPQQVHYRTEQFQQRMDTFFAPIVDELAALRSMALKRVISLDESDAKMTHAVIETTIEEKPSLSVNGFVLADTKGRELKWIHTGNQWEQVTSEYDIQTRPWFKATLQADDPNKVLWSGVYTFHSRQKPGVTIAQSYTLAGEDERHVIAFDIALSDFVSFVTKMDIAPEAHLLLYQDKKIADLTDYAALLQDSIPGEDDFWKGLADLKDSIQVAAVSAWIKEGVPLGAALKFSDGKETYWTEFNHQTPENFKTQLAVVIPETVMVQTARQIVIWFFAATGVALVSLAIILVLLLRRQSRLLNERFTYAGHIRENQQQLLGTIAIGENSQLEFKSTLRWHLKAGKPAKEIEIACMKTLAAFLNSQGGTLLVGVEDNGNLLGVEQDGFPNDDKFLLHFNNLIKQHLGLECAPFLAFEIKRIDDKNILVVDCGRATSPVFVKHADKENFYIRVGPGTRQLATSEVLTYTSDHFE